MKKNNPVTFICFDILYKGKDLTNLYLINRKKFLDKFKDTNIFVKSKYFEEKGKDLFKFVKKENLEGIIAKKKNSSYFYDTRTKEWIKIKNFKEEEFFISGFVTIKNKNVISVLLSEKIDDKYFFVGKLLFSYKNKDYKKIISSKSVKNYLENCKDKSTFIKPLYKVKVNYMERTKNNMLRQPFIKNNE